MASLRYKTITDLVKGRDNGDFDESLLFIEVDNDGVFFGLKAEGKDDYSEIEVDWVEGYRDVKELYQLLFSKANVDWV